VSKTTWPARLLAKDDPTWKQQWAAR